MNMKHAVFLYLLLMSSPAAGQGIDIHGFTEGAFGSRVQSNALLKESEYTLGETRLQLQFARIEESAEFYSTVDLLADNVEGTTVQTVIREAYLQFSLGSRADIKVGRQILTWGTGDLLFINDLFPKDYISFFTGREDPYLKLPSDALKLRVFTPFFDADIIGIPFFGPDLLPTGKRLSFYHPLAGSVVGETQLPPPLLPEQKLGKSEIALRLYRYLGSFQVSGYFFRGFFKDPMAVNPLLGRMYYPELSAYGASFRGPLGQGVLSLEYGFYDSRMDRNGSNPLLPNSQHRYILGFEQQGWTDFTAGIQYYGEYMADYDAYRHTLPEGAPRFSRLRQVLTARMTQLLKYQTVTLSLFAFYSPSDRDWHIRPGITYRYSDQVSLSAGGNFFGGGAEHTLFGQFEENNNLYTRFRYYF